MDPQIKQITEIIQGMSILLISKQFDIVTPGLTWGPVFPLQKKVDPGSSPG
jgi:hypothetical protein